MFCTTSVTEGVPRWRKGSGEGWVTAEYSMLPRHEHPRRPRVGPRQDRRPYARDLRLIGRFLRAVIDYKALGENTIVLDCDVLQADGGTRTAAITGAYVALADAITWAQGKKLVKPGRKPLTGTVSAVSVGIVGGIPLLDLCYEVGGGRHRHERRLHRRRTLRRGPGRRGGQPFDRKELNALLDLAVAGCDELATIQRAALEATAE